MDEPISVRGTTRAAEVALPGHRSRAVGEVARVRLTGDVEHPQVLTVAGLRELPQHVVEAGFECGRRGVRRHVFEGVLLLDVVTAAGPGFDSVIAKDRVRFLLAVTGRDGHCAVVSWGEIDPRYGGGGVLVATSMDGRLLDEDGPHLVVPRDVAGGRYVSRIVSIWVGQAGQVVARQS
jgi:hypothetical protein